MIYIITLFIVLIFVLKYDILCSTKNKGQCYRLLMIWFVAVSGFAYNVGADCPEYMYLYDEISPSSFSGWKNLFSSDRYQPAWYVLNLLCHYVSDDYVVLKLVISIFLNTVVFWFIKRHSSKWFIAILFYAVMMFLNLNFNALRQAVAVGFFLIGYDYLSNNKFGYYFLFLGIAYLFHSSAILMVVVPLVRFCTINKFTALFSFVSVGILLFLLLSKDLSGLLWSLADVFGASESEELARSSSAYLLNTEESTINSFGVLRHIFELLLYLFIVIYNFNKINVWDNALILLFVIFSVMSIFVPIVFFRLFDYVHLIYFCVLSDTIVSVSNKMVDRTCRVLSVYLLIFFFLFTPFTSYFRINPTSGIPLKDQYAPYYSVFNKQFSSIRVSNFGSHQ